MLEVASPEDIQKLPDIQTWLDWMQRVEEEVIHKKRADIRRFIVDGILNDAAQRGATVRESDFSEAFIRINKTTLPPDFDLYGNRRDFYIPTVSFRDKDTLITVLLKYGFFGGDSYSLHIPPKRFPQREVSSGFVPLVPQGIRPVSVLLASSRGIKQTLAAHTAMSVDPFAQKRDPGEIADTLLGRWAGLLHLAKDPKTELKVINDLMAELPIYYQMIHPQTGKANPSEMGRDAMDILLLQSSGPVDLAKIEEKEEINRSFKEKEATERLAFCEKPFGKLAGYDPKRIKKLNQPAEIIAPLYNFLRELVHQLGHGQALSLLLRSPSLNALATHLSEQHPEMDFAATAYKDMNTILSTIHRRA